MTFYAVVEDFDNGRSYSDNEHYENQLIGVFCDKNMAMNHLLDGVKENMFTDKSNYNSMVLYHVNEECPTLGGATLVRRICQISTNNSCKRLSGKFILSQSGSSFEDYIADYDIISC